LTEDSQLRGCTTTLKTEQAPLGIFLDGNLRLLATVIEASLAQASLVILKGGGNSVMNYRALKRRVDDGVYWLLLGYDARGRSVGLTIEKHFDGTFTRTGILVFSKGTSVWLHPSAKRRVVTVI